MKDMIDKRNEKERISRGIVKYWNVNYVPYSCAGERASVQTLPEEKPEKVVSQPVDPSHYGEHETTDEVMMGQIEQILHEKSDSIRHLFEVE